MFQTLLKLQINMFSQDGLILCQKFSSSLVSNEKCSVLDWVILESFIQCKKTRTSESSGL